MLTKIYTKNADFQMIEALRRNRVKRNRAGLFFVEGVRPINQAIAHAWQIEALIYPREKPLSEWAKRLLRATTVHKLYELPFELMDELSQKEESSELIALVRMPGDDLSRIPERANPLVVVLDRPHLPGNIGAIIRSCDALQADGLILTGHSADLYDPETIRATTGSLFSLPTVRIPSQNDLLPWLDHLGHRYPNLQIVGTDEKGDIPIDQQDFTRPTVLLSGNETLGLSQNYRALCDTLVKIPMLGSASSLNLACATSIVLYEINRQRRSGRY